MREQRLRLGEEIRVARERRGLTRVVLADRAGIGRMVVSRIERGVTNLDLDVLQRIGFALHRPVVVSFGRDLEESPVDAGHLAMQESFSGSAAPRATTAHSNCRPGRQRHGARPMSDSRARPRDA
jgi:transcriptional regulator with XRE-family HTH domain